MLSIKVLGPGCANCVNVAATAQRAVDTLGVGGRGDRAVLGGRQRRPAPGRRVGLAEADDLLRQRLGRRGDLADAVALLAQPPEDRMERGRHIEQRGGAEPPKPRREVIEHDRDPPLGGRRSDRTAGRR